MLESEAMAVLVSAVGVGYAHRERALRAAGSAAALLEEPAAYAQALGDGGVRAVMEAKRRSGTMLERLLRDNVHLILRESEGYPPLLRQIARPPHLLFCAGRADLSDAFPIAVVGMRNAGEYGLRHTRKISRQLADAGVCIVSGLALGVDASAHQGALDCGGRTVAVLGGALDRMYPQENLGLMERILACGGSVVSEYAPGVKPNRYSFLERNRIIAGMSLGTLVTQGGARSGASFTARCALEEGREVFALPGDIDREESILPNRLIGEGARLVTCAADILDSLVIEPDRCAKREDATAGQKDTAGVHGGSAQKMKRENKTGTSAQKSVQKKPKRDKALRGGGQDNPPPVLKKPQPQGELEKRICALLAGGEKDFDALSEEAGVTSEELGAALMMMELDGLIESLPGCLYRLA